MWLESKLNRMQCDITLRINAWKLFPTNINRLLCNQQAIYYIRLKKDLTISDNKQAVFTHIVHVEGELFCQILKNSFGR